MSKRKGNSIKKEENLTVSDVIGIPFVAKTLNAFPTVFVFGHRDLLFNRKGKTIKLNINITLIKSKCNIKKK